MTNDLSRREFLKAAGLFSLVGLPIIQGLDRLSGAVAAPGQPNVLN